MLCFIKFYISVELPGVEPGSKQSAKTLSTCLASSWLSGTCRQEAAQPIPYSLWFSSCYRGLNNLIHPFLMLWAGTPDGGASRGAIGRLILVIKRPMRNCNRCHLCGLRVGFNGPCTQSPGMLTIPLSLLSKPVSPVMLIAVAKIQPFQLGPTYCGPFGEYIFRWK